MTQGKPFMLRRYSIVATARDGHEAVIAQVDTHPGNIAKAARKKFLINTPYVRISIRDNSKTEKSRHA
jgi:hypothetical protein